MGRRPGRDKPVAWKGLAAPRCNKRRRRLPASVLEALNDVQAQILQTPARGERKRGVLRDIWVEKFKAANDQYLVAYAIDDERRAVVFYDVGQHENFCRDLSKYLRADPGEPGPSSKRGGGDQLQ